ncbi:MAG: tRNA (guanosine(37)-N1)-methyltransferase TrmD [Dehalococcoidales bacterium]|nr:MAG: tRNA (guanosine(37)-N1)-methyltransferase TrmD [Dehalococcoidales bacterium]
MRIDILTLFPEMFESILDTAIFKRAGERDIVNVVVRNIRDYTHDKHRTVDDYPYGGGAGMVLKPEPIFEAVQDILEETDSYHNNKEEAKVILLTPQGRKFSQEIAVELSHHNHLIFICGHYEGVDERVREYLVNDEISIGDYVLSGGETAAMVVTDAVVRLVPDVLGSPESQVEESHNSNLLEYPQYTRPPEYRGWEVPEILLSGNHGEIARWRREQAILRTASRRPDLLRHAELSPEEKRQAEGLQKPQD